MRYRSQSVVCVVVAVGLQAYSPTGYSGTAGNGASQRNAASAQPATPANSQDPAAATPGATAANSPLAVTVEPVASAPEDQSPQRIVISPDGHHIAFVSTRGSRFVVVVDGKPTPKYDEIGHIHNAVNKEIIFSADGQHVMYIARRSDDEMVVVDGNEMVGYQLVDQFSFSPDGKQNAFIAQHDQQNAHQLAVVNGKDSPFYVTVTDLQFSANNAHVAYVGTVADPSKPANTTVVIDGKSEKPFYHVHDFHFSADGNHWAYVGEDFTGNVPAGASVQKSHMMADGKELAAYETIYNCQISPDGHVAYTANKSTHQGTPAEGMLTDECAGLDAQVWDVAKGHRFAAHGNSPLTLSPDGQHVAWLEEHPGNNELCVSVNGKRGIGYHGIQNIAFSPDSQHINYVAQQSANGIYVVRDEDESGPYQRTPNGMSLAFTLYFSPDGKHLAYQAGDGKMTFVVEDGKQQTPYEAIYGPLVFSPDGEHLAYIAQAKDPTANMTPIQRQQAQQSPNHSPGIYIVLDGQQQPVLPSVKFGSAANHSALHFSPDSKHLAYTDDWSKVVVDGRLATKATKTQNGALGNGMDATFHFTPDSKHDLWAQNVTTTSGMGAVHYMIDGDEVIGYQLAGTGGSNAGIPNYQPTLDPNGTIFFFAIKDGTTGTVTGSGPHATMTSPALYRITVNPGPPRDFGTTASDLATNTPPTPTQQQTVNSQSNPPAPANPTPANTTTPPPPNNSQSAIDKETAKAQKAKNTADRLRSLFGH